VDGIFGPPNKIWHGVMAPLIEQVSQIRDDIDVCIVVQFAKCYRKYNVIRNGFVLQGVAT